MGELFEKNYIYEFKGHSINVFILQYTICITFLRGSTYSLDFHHVHTFVPFEPSVIYNHRWSKSITYHRICIRF